MNNTNVRVDLRIMGNEFDVQVISNEIGILPTMSWNIGDHIRDTDKVRTYTAWIFSTGAEETMDVNTQLRKIENRFLSKASMLCKLKKEYNLEICIDIVIIIENQSPPAIYLDSSIINFASNIDARFDIDTYIN